MEHLPALPALRQLELSDCSLTSVPQALARLSGLTSLSLRDSPALGHSVSDAAWQALAALPALSELTLQACGLAALPPVLSAVTSLGSLDVSHNDQLPPGSLKMLAGLPKLHTVGIAGCSLCSGLRLPSYKRAELQAALSAL